MPRRPAQGGHGELRRSETLAPALHLQLNRCIYGDRTRRIAGSPCPWHLACRLLSRVGGGREMENADHTRRIVRVLKVSRALLPALVFVAVQAPVPAWAHGGGLNSEGCHTVSRTGDYHCHRASSRATPREAPKRSRSARSAFRRVYPCPTTGETTGSCPGYEVDHVVPLACGGRDAPGGTIACVCDSRGHDVRNIRERAAAQAYCVSGRTRRWF